MKEKKDSQSKDLFSRRIIADDEVQPEKEATLAETWCLLRIYKM